MNINEYHITIRDSEDGEGKVWFGFNAGGKDMDNLPDTPATVALWIVLEALRAKMDPVLDSE